MTVESYTMILLDSSSGNISSHSRLHQSSDEFEG